MIQAVQRFLLFSIIFFNISQLGKHFWPYFAYVSGIRVDYLSPTLYLTDILIILLIGVWLISQYSRIPTQKFYISLALHALVFILSVSIIVSKYPLPALYGSVKVLEMIFLGYIVSRHVSRKSVLMTCFLLSTAMIIEGILVISQILSQSSIGGLWYFLGERTFSSASIGISTVSVFSNEILRAYGSFPHPNVLAFYCVVVCTLLLTQLQNISSLLLKTFYWIAIVFSLICLFSTFSRLSIFVLIGIIGFLSFKNEVSRKIGMFMLGVGFIFILLFIERFSISSFISSDLFYRWDLAKIGLKIVLENPFFGVGMSNYLYYQIDYQRSITPVLLQPPHNVFLLILLQTGGIGLIFSIYFLARTSMRAKSYLNSNSPLHVSASLLFFAILIIGMGDHYFVTLQQGMIMTAFVIGLVWAPTIKQRIKD